MFFGNSELLERSLHNDLNNLIKNVKVREDQHFLILQYNKNLIIQQKEIDFIGYDIEEGNDIRDKFNLDKYFEQYKVDTVIHLAARAGVRKSAEFPEEYFSTNISGTQNLIELSQKYNIKRFVFFSSSSEDSFRNKSA